MSTPHARPATSAPHATCGSDPADVPFSRGATIAPDMSTIAHIVDWGGYPRAVQRELVGGVAGPARPVMLPIEGPITKIRYSPDGHWLACQTAPYAGVRQQIWAVTNDPDDRRAVCLVTATDGTCELVAWTATEVCVTVEKDDGGAEAIFVDPQTGAGRGLELPPLGRLLDSWDGWSLVRLGGRGDRHVLLAGDDVVLEPLAADPGSTTDLADIVEDHRVRWLPGPAGARAVAPMARDEDGYLRVLVRSDHDADRLHLMQLTYVGGRVYTSVLAHRDDADLDEFTVSNDASTVALVWNVGGGRTELQLLHLDDRSLAPVVPLAGRIASEPSLSVDGSLLSLTVQGPDLTPVVALLNTRTGEWSQVGDAASAPAIHPESLHVTARDGLQLQGWWYAAADPGESGPAPTVLLFHGGPEGQARPDFNPFLNALVEGGYNVFAPNVRGSGGFGRAFSHADDVELRFDGIDDVADIVEELSARGLVDPGRIACVGWSYGGYLALASLTFHPGLFVTGVSICGMSDLPAFYESTETWIGKAAQPKYGHPVRDAALLDDLSPINRIEQLRAPVLLVHGAHDTNVPVSQSTSFRDAVVAAGGIADLVLYDDEGHELVRRDNIADLARRAIAWLDTHGLPKSAR